MGEPDRRKNAPGPEGVYVDCRRCWRHIKLDPARVEIDNGHVVYRCQNCGDTFGIRDTDVAALGVSDRPR